MLRILAGYTAIGLLIALPGFAGEVEEELNSGLVIENIVDNDGWQGFLRSPSSLFFDAAAGELFVADAGNNRIVIYDSDLSAKFSFDHFVPDKLSGKPVKGEPKDLVVNSYGEIFLIDNLVSYIDVLDFRGKPLARIDPTALLGDTSLQIRGQGIAIDAKDNLYLAITGDVVGVLKIDPNFALLRTIGKKGTAPEDFNTPLGITVRNDLLVVTDLYARPAVKVFDTSGTFKYGFGAHDIDKADVSFPSGVAVLDNIDGNYSIWIVDGLRQIIKVYDNKGTFLAHVGGYGYGPGEFRYPADIAAGQDSSYFIVERVGNRIQSCRIH